MVEEGNKLFPVFLKLEKLRLLIIGGGNVALEKLNAVLQNSPSAFIHLVGVAVSDDIYQLGNEFANIIIDERPYSINDMEEADIIIAAVNDIATSKQIRDDAHKAGRLVNIADKPELCDFYLSAVVKKGNLKIAISTNGTSPTIAKRLKEQINEMMPDEIEDVLQNMQIIRKDLNGDFAEKVRQLNNITNVLAAKNSITEETKKPGTKKWQKIVAFCLLAFCFMILGHELLSYFPLHDLLNAVKTVPQYVDIKPFAIMFLTGFIAQMVDGSLGMGYGTISTTFLLANG